MRTSAPSSRRRAPARAFTIVEVLATMMLAAIVLPAVVSGLLLCMDAAGWAAQQNRAVSLAQSKLDELVATGNVVDAEMSGDFGDEYPQYTWVAYVNEWDDIRLSQLDVSVLWTRRGQQREVTLSTLVYTGGPSE